MFLYEIVSVSKMLKYKISIIVPLIISLFIYTFYRAEETNVNLLLKYVFQSDFQSIQVHIREAIPLHSVIIYNLPESLWVFSITLLGANLFIRIKHRKIYLIYFPIVFVLLLEILQLLKITDGTFDLLDIVISSAFWLLALAYCSTYVSSLRELKNNRARFILFIIVFSLAYLSDLNN
jgi:hypothetical protein